MTDAPKIKKSALVPIEPIVFIDALGQGALNYKIELTEEQKAQLCAYYVQLVETNRVMNLTGITEAAAVAEKHIIDSLLLLQHVAPYESVIDVGTGAGLPGVPLAIAVPQAKTVLLDSLKKRCDFLSRLVAEIPLENSEVIWARAEEGGQNPDHREKYDLAVARAVAPLPVLLEYLLPFVKVGGEVCALKGAKASEEVQAAQKAAQTLGAEFIKTVDYELAGEQHCLIILKKTKKTHAKYPRSAAMIKKSPL